MVSVLAGVRASSLRSPATRTQPKRLSILGATGSIGRSCAQVIAAAPGRFSVVSIAGGRDAAALERCAIELDAEFGERISEIACRPKSGPAISWSARSRRALQVVGLGEEGGREGLRGKLVGFDDQD